jgi:NAD(P)H-nitrite reductase large subunit
MAVGAKPNTELAADAGLEVDPNLDGYLVNAELQARTNLYVVSFKMKSFFFILNSIFDI